jgi:hypothetical protein
VLEKEAVMRVSVTVGRVAFALLLWSGMANPMVLAAQGPDGRWPLQPRSGIERIVAPFMEGWYANEDGTYSFSFGYLNRNEHTVEIPLGDANSIEPAQFQGTQPTTFLPGRHRGVFAVTVPADLRDQDVWWIIRNPNGEVTRVPGRTGAAAYQLDWYPRPHGTVPPSVSFDSGTEEGRGPPGIIAERTLTVSAGSPLTVSINTRDTSERDLEDFRFREAISLRVVWSKYQGPVDGMVEFTRHESTPIPEEEATDPDGGGGDQEDGPAGAETIMLPDGEGVARVVATFSEPGEYILHAQVDNWRATDSSSGNQCCWTNGYVRVTVR